MAPTTLRPHPKNPRLHPESAIEKLVRSIQHYGWTQPILVSSDDLVLAGHARLKAALKAGLETVPIIRLPLEGARAEAHMIADNRLQEETEWAPELLGALLKDLEDQLEDLSTTGLDPNEIDSLLAASGLLAEIEQDEVPDPPDEPVTRPGDLWVLGTHRLLCGDATSTNLWCV